MPLVANFPEEREAFGSGDVPEQVVASDRQLVIVDPVSDEEDEASAFDWPTSIAT